MPALPKKITDHLLITAVEVRFTSSYSVEDIPTIFFPIFKDEFPKIQKLFNTQPVGAMAFAPSVGPQADIAFYNEKFSISIGVASITFGCNGDYLGWGEYQSLIKQTLQRIEPLGIAKSIDRIALRYGSVFEQPKTLEGALNIHPILQQEDWKQQVAFSVVKLDKEDFTIVLQLGNSIKALSRTKAFEGMYVDIDVSMSKSLAQSFSGQLFSQIDRLHTLEKELFFSLLKPEFLASLNPQY
jgi:uncharacterized protein (TIGR04255 family)